ncbi:hypothetical protein [Aeromonas rivipollensis]|uniref:hypothetical protein n=2 Tax=Aeromonas rivipollensis TaxID=948519 RepID=UPI003D1C4BBA
MDDVFYKSTLKTGAMITGYYRYKDVFQIQRSREKQSSIYDGSFMDIEYNDKYRMINLNSEEKKNVYGQGYGHLDFLKELIALLYICTNQHCELYDNGGNVRPGPQQIISGFTKTDRHQLRKSDARILARMNSCQDFVELQSQTDLFLDKYFQLDITSRTRINTSLFLLQNMRKIMLSSISMGIVGLISAIENLVDFNGERTGYKPARCQHCNQLLYSVTKRFNDFMSEHSEKHFIEKYKVKNSYYIEDDFMNKKASKLIKEFYSRRSKITHAGDILEIDRILSSFPMHEVRLFNELETYVRIALFSYILHYEK